MKKAVFMISIILMFTLLLCVSGAEADVVTGSCGTSVNYSLNKNYSTYTLTITGNGAMTNFTSADKAPWYIDRAKITKIEIKNGVTSIGDWAFYSTAVETIDLPYSVNSIGKRAFDSCSKLYRFTSYGTDVKEIKEYTFYNCTELGMYTNTLPKALETIGDNAFYGCKSTYFKELTLPDTVISIGKNAFYHCSEITKVILSEELQTIGTSCFDGCTKLENLTLKSKIRSIGASAFSYTAIKTLALPDSLTSLGANAFRDCSSLKTVSMGSGLTAIGEWAFYNCTSMTSLILPKRLKTIGTKAFYHCSSLTGIIIPDGVTTIGEQSFYNCSALAKVYLPSSLNSLGSQAFNSCSALKNIDLPSNISQIKTPTTCFPAASTTTLYCKEGSTTATQLKNGSRTYTALTINDWTISGQAVHWTFSTSTGVLRVWGKLTAAAGSTLTANSKYPWYSNITYITMAELGDEVEAVTPYMFKGYSNLVCVRLSDGITSIGDHAFETSSKLEYITLPSGLQTIGSYAFASCSMITSLQLPDTLTTIGSYGLKGTGIASIILPPQCNSIGSYALSGCNSLKEVLFNNNMTTIPESMFEACRYMTSIEIPQGVTTIGKRAFWDCTRLTTLILPEGITSVDSTSFYNNSSTQIAPTVRYNSTTTQNTLKRKGYRYWMFDNAARDGQEDTIIWALNPDGTELTISGNGPMRDLGYMAWPNITTLTVTGDITRLGAGLCRNCQQLCAFNVSAKTFIMQIGDSAFENCSALTALPSIGPNAVINNRAFMNSGLTSINEASIEHIGEKAFYGCNKLTSVSIQPKTIGDSAFECCPSITSLSLGVWLESVGANAFMHSGGIFDLTLPQSLTSIGAYAFANMQDNDRVFLGNQITTIGEKAFGNLSELKIFVCKSGTSTDTALMNAGYRGNAQEWETYGYGDPWYIKDGVLYIFGKGNYSFSSFSATPWYNKVSQITKIVVAPSVTGIGKYAFQNLYNVTEAELPAGLTSIGYYAFNGCSKLTELILPDNISTLKYNSSYNKAFNTATALYCQPNTSTASALEDANCSYISMIDYGKYGSLKWMLLFTGSLRIYGSGSMPDYETASEQPWYPYADSITLIRVENGIDRIGNRSFDELTSVTGISLDNNIQSIGSYAFQSMAALTELSLPDSLVSIGAYAFSGTGIQNLNIPADITSISEAAFCGADALVSFQVASANTRFKSLNNVLFNKDMTELISYPAQKGVDVYTVPSGVRRIGEHAFHTINQSNTILQRVILPDSLESIGAYAFATNADGTVLANICFAGNPPAEIDATAFSGLDAIGYYGFSVAEYWQNAAHVEGITWSSSCDCLGDSIVAEHAWGEVSYILADDNSSVTATRICSNNVTHIETETVETSAEVTRQANCTETEQTTYSAKFENVAFTAWQEVVETAPALDHEWGTPNYEWNADNSKVTATRVCRHNANHVETETANATSEVTKAATCEANGETTYTGAAFKNTAFTVQTKTVDDVPAMGHAWGVPTYEWNADNSKVTATRVCGHDESHVETETANADSEVTKPATCETKGETTYTGAEFENTVFTAQTKVVDDIPAKGHTLTAHAKVEATCTEAGTEAYWDCSVCKKLFSDEECTSEIEALVVIPATGHTMTATAGKAATCTEPGNSAYWQCTTCNKFFSDADGETEIEENSWIIPANGHTLTAHAKAEATCTEAGTEAYWDCSVCNKLFGDENYGTELEAPVVIPAKGHNWNTPTYVWADDNATVTATRICQNGDYQETESVATSRELVTVPTDKEAGAYRIVSKAFSNPAFEIQSKTNLVIPALEDMNVLKLPAFLTTIETEAFVGIAAEAIIIPDTCTTIQSKAFINCKNLLFIHVPAGVEIPDDAFSGCPNVVIDQGM